LLLLFITDNNWSCALTESITATWLELIKIQKQPRRSHRRQLFDKVFFTRKKSQRSWLAFFLFFHYLCQRFFTNSTHFSDSA